MKNSTKMGADESAENTPNTPNAPKFICPNYLPNPKSLALIKKASLVLIQGTYYWAAIT